VSWTAENPFNGHQRGHVTIGGQDFAIFFDRVTGAPAGDVTAAITVIASLIT